MHGPVHSGEQCLNTLPHLHYSCFILVVKCLIIYYWSECKIKLQLYTSHGMHFPKQGQCAAAFVFLVAINCKVVRTDATVDTRKCSSLTQYSQVGLTNSTSNSVQTSSKNNVSLDQFWSFLHLLFEHWVTYHPGSIANISACFFQTLDAANYHA